MSFRLLTLTLFIGLAFASQAQPVPVPAPPPVPAPAPNFAKYLTFASTNDVIVVGALQEVTLPDVPKEVGAARAAATARVQLLVQKVLKGPGKLGLMELRVPLGLAYSTDIVGNPPKAKYTIKGWTPSLKKDDQYVVGLQNGPGGLGLPAYGQSLQPADAADGIAAVLAKMPLTVVTALALKALTFGENLKVTVTVKNTSGMPQTVTGAWLSGMYLSTKVGPYAELRSQTTVPAFWDLTNGKATPLVVKPDETATVTMTAQLGKPAAWQMLGPSTLLLTPMIIRPVLSLQVPGADGNPGTAQVAGQWQVLQVGYTMPELPAQ
ncbi:MAG: hypothetical protein WCJ56_04575 [bacterium]